MIKASISDSGEIQALSNTVAENINQNNLCGGQTWLLKGAYPLIL